MHYLKTESGETPPPKEIGFLFRKVLEGELGRGDMNLQGRRKNHLGGLS